MGKKQSDVAPLSLHRYIMGGLLVLIVGIGAWLVFEVRSHEDDSIRSELLRQAASIASTLSVESIRDLSFRAEDAELPAYQRITSQLQVYSKTIGIERLYTLGLRDGQLFFGPGGPLSGDSYATRPGTIHQKPSPTDFEAFRTGEPHVAELHSDEFGEFVSALVPVVDTLSGEVLLVVGLDMEAAKWRKKIQEAQQTPLWSTLSILSLLLLGYLVHGTYKRSPNMRMEILRNIQILIYFSVMLLLTGIAFICVRDVEQKIQQERFKTEAAAKSQHITDAIDQIDLVLHLLIGFFEGSENITREEFGSFCRHILEGYPIEACYWIPAWSATDAPKFTARIQSEGLPDFSIRRFSTVGQAGQNPADPIYPAVYAEPASRLPTALGYDFYSHPVLRETLAETLRTGSDQACMVSSSTPNSTDPSGFFVFAPVSHPRQRGLVCFSINLDALIQGAPSSDDVEAISKTLYGLSPDQKPQPLACSSCDPCEDMFAADLSAHAPLFAFGNTCLMLFTAERQWFATNHQHTAWLILGIGLTLTLLLTYTAAVLINRPILLAKRVIKRTRELAESKERFDIAIAAAKMGVWEHDIGKDRLIWNDRMMEIYGIQKDEFDGDGKKWSQYIHPADHNHFMREWMESEHKGKAFASEFRIIRPDGEIRHISVFGKIIYGEAGTAERMIGVNLDITERKQSQQALEESRQLLCNIIDTMPERVWWKDLDSRFMGCNIHVAHDAGFEHPDQLIGKTDFDLCWAVHAERFQASDREVMNSGVPRLCDPELQVLEDGSTRWIEVSMIPLKDTAGKVFGVLGSYSDITARMQAEEKLIASEERYRLLFDNMTTGFALHEIIYDDSGNPADYRYLQINPAFETLTGLTAEKSIGRTVKELMPETEAYWIETFGKVAKTGEAMELENYAAAFGKFIEVRAFSPEQDQFAVVFSDITARRESEEKLIRLSTAIDQSPESIVITDTNGCILYINPAFANNTGYTAEEVLGQNPRILKSGEHLPAFYAEMWEILLRGEVWEGRLINKRKDGTIYTEEATISPVRDAEGKTVNYVAVKRDITHELAKEEELRQAQKMEAVGELAGGVAHDFNNILQGIIGFSELLRYSLDDASLEYKNADEIHKSANRAAKLTQQLLTFSRKQAVRLEENDLNNIVYDSEALLHVLLGDTYQVVLDLRDELPPVYADRGQLSQVIMNLAVNARDAMPKGGRLSISTECIHIGKADVAYMAGARPGSYLCLAVTDTGAGMDDQTQRRIFDPFFTTKPVGSGTGLGLAVIYGIVQQNRGWINVYSEIGKGSCFKVYLPVADACEKKTEDDSPADQKNRNAQILLIEDDPKILNMMKKVLGAENLTMIAAGSAEEGLTLYDQSADGFDLLMSDMELPGMRGDELAEALRLKDPELPVLLFSGYRDQVNRWKNIADKGYLFLNKPFTITILLDTVRGVLLDTKGTHG